MKIIILGAGQVGGTLAETLSGENNDITVVDTDTARLRQLQDKFDLRVVAGYASHPRVLREAGAEDADMLVAVTNSDETNMVACQIAYSLFNTPNRIARIRSAEYVRAGEQLFQAEAVPIDHLISPEQLVGHRQYLQADLVSRCATGGEFRRRESEYRRSECLLRWPADR